MNFLVLDTSSNACSVAVRVDDRVVNNHLVEARAHTRELLPMIIALLEECELAVSDLDAVILGNGPGSFIGMRIGASVAQGLCFGARIKIVPISSLAVVAAEVFLADDVRHVVIAQDARMGEVYRAEYQRSKDGGPELIGDESIVDAASLQITYASSVVAGCGWDRYAVMMENNRDKIKARSNVNLPNARVLMDIGATAYANGAAIEPERLAPAYLRNKVAEIPQVEV